MAARLADGYFYPAAWEAVARKTVRLASRTNGTLAGDSNSFNEPVVYYFFGILLLNRCKCSFL